MKLINGLLSNPTSKDFLEFNEAFNQALKENPNHSLFIEYLRFRYYDSYDMQLFVDKITEEENEKYVGTIQKVLVEGVSKTNENVLTGRTKSSKVVNFAGDKSLIGKEIDIRIISQHIWYLKGEII